MTIIRCLHKSSSELLFKHSISIYHKSIINMCERTTMIYRVAAFAGENTKAVGV